MMLLIVAMRKIEEDSYDGFLVSVRVLDVLSILKFLRPIIRTTLPTLGFYD